MLRERLAQVRERIRQACQRCGRDPASVTLVAVTKGVGVERIREAILLGLKQFGENRVQEAHLKQQELSRGREPFTADRVPETVHGTPYTVHDIKWHLIGHLQRNKARDAARIVQMIHSVDSMELADALDRQVQDREPMDVLVQVNVSGEATRFGCREDAVGRLVQEVGRRPHLRVRGLMTMAPFTEDPEAARPIFRRLRELRDDAARALSLEPSALSLSMGMSNDFEVAIEEGADFVRIGTALFGARDA